MKKSILGSAVLLKTAPSIDSLKTWRSEIAFGATQMEKIAARSSQVFEPLDPTPP
jgi:hypothetical protein